MARVTLVLPPDLQRRLCRQLREAFPAEGCGVLLGDVEGQARLVRRLVPTENRWEGRNDRYLVDPGTLRRLLEGEDEPGARILGFYHSHPEAEPVPSSTDLERAWPWYYYLIVRVDPAGVGSGRLWTLDEEEGRLVERPLDAEPPLTAAPEAG